MIAVITVIFALAGTFLLYSSFNTMLSRQKQSAAKSFEIVINTFSLLGQESIWTDNDEISKDFEKIADANDLFYAIRLRSDDEIIYDDKNLGNENIDSDNLDSDKTDSNNLDNKNPDNDNLFDLVDYDNIAYKIINRDNEYFILFCSVIKGSSSDFYVDALYDITYIYEQRNAMQRTYLATFLLMIICGALLSYVMSYFLTKPIERLKETASKISEGQYENRSKIHTGDEIEALSNEFNHMTDTLVDKMEMLNASVERQNRFIADFTHELKTPMTSMIGYADLLRRQNLSLDEQAEAANYIYSESRRLERLSTKMLEIIVTQNDTVDLAASNPSKLIDDTVSHYASSFEKSGIKIIKKCDAGECVLEPDLFVSLVINLLENARRAMPSGGTINITMKKYESDWCLSVSDTGCGIPKDKLSHITEAFYRVDKARSRAAGGAGLGLSLCENIARLHGGRIEIESEVGVGTTVSVTLRAYDYGEQNATKQE